MSEAINPVGIFVPVLVIVALTFVAFVRMAAARAAAVRAGQDPAYYRAHLGTPEPEATVAAVRHYGNLFELPVLFYTGCLTAFVLGAVSGWTLLFAWGYVAGRVVQSLVHLTANNPAHRGLGFVVGMFFIIALWVNLALAIFARL
ncbi:MAPEG family protein [Sphingobium sufflavum]|uniref:MAPEG family protein n=1 Tax=Sphingobium sufflavum TaxID=1129547 RepID=UPI001F40E75A|nr:MAPEG family protein [Sphingobium sufflavum]MCE7797989.1 MAPEG family protein [Sphingobium sufflavum]